MLRSTGVSWAHPELGCSRERSEVVLGIHWLWLFHGLLQEVFVHPAVQAWQHVEWCLCARAVATIYPSASSPTPSLPNGRQLIAHCCVPRSGELRRGPLMKQLRQSVDVFGINPLNIRCSKPIAPSSVLVTSSDARVLAWMPGATSSFLCLVM